MEDKLTACGKCENIMYTYIDKINYKVIKDTICYASPNIIPFDPIYGENYIDGYKICREINDGHCPNFKSKYEPIVEHVPVEKVCNSHSEERWWQFWK